MSAAWGWGLARLSATQPCRRAQDLLATPVRTQTASGPSHTPPHRRPAAVPSVSHTLFCLVLKIALGVGTVSVSLQTWKLRSESVLLTTGLLVNQTVFLIFWPHITVKSSASFTIINSFGVLAFLTHKLTVFLVFLWILCFSYQLLYLPLSIQSSSGSS